MREFALKRNDSKPIQVKLEKEQTDGTWKPAFTSSGLVTAVRFFMRLPGATTPKVNAAATIVQADATACIVQYVLTTGDTDTTGDYQAEVQVTYTSGQIETFPTKGYLTVSVAEDIG